MIYRTDEATAEHAVLIAPYLRATDIADLAIMDRPVLDALTHSIKDSLWAKTLFADGCPVMLFGVGAINGDIGCPWMVGTPWIERHKRAFFRHVVPWLDVAFDDFRVLMNVTLPESVAALRFLEFMGFEFGEPVRFDGRDVVPFKKERDEHV